MTLWLSAITMRKRFETIGGKVSSIEKTAPAKRRGYWVDLMLQSEKETIAVQLARLGTSTSRRRASKPMTQSW